GGGGGGGGGREGQGMVVYGGGIEIEPEDGLEPDAPQRGGDVLRVVARVRQPLGVLVGAVADDERNALLCERRRGQGRNRNEHGNDECRRTTAATHGDAPPGRKSGQSLCQWACGAMAGLCWRLSNRLGRGWWLSGSSPFW